MNTPLPADLEQCVQAKVRGGRVCSRNEVITPAVRLLREREEDEESRVEERLRQGLEDMRAVSSSTTQPTLDYDRFLSLTGTDLVAYMEPIVTDPPVAVPPGAPGRIASEIDTYDEYHLFYGLELGPDLAPDLFAPALPRFLSHKSQAVRCAASRALNRLPDRLITKPLVDAARTALSSCPEDERDSWAHFLDDLSKRHRA